MKERQVSVIIVNYRTSRLVLDCLASLALERDSFPEFTLSWLTTTPATIQ